MDMVVGKFLRIFRGNQCNLPAWTVTGLPGFDYAKSEAGVEQIIFIFLPHSRQSLEIYTKLLGMFIKMVSKPTKALDNVTIGRQITIKRQLEAIRGNQRQSSQSLEQFIKYYKALSSVQALSIT